MSVSKNFYVEPWPPMWWHQEAGPLGSEAFLNETPKAPWPCGMWGHSGKTLSVTRKAPYQKAIVPIPWPRTSSLQDHDHKYLLFMSNLSLFCHGSCRDCDRTVCPGSGFQRLLKETNRRDRAEFPHEIRDLPKLLNSWQARQTVHIGWPALPVWHAKS